MDLKSFGSNGKLETFPDHPDAFRVVLEQSSDGVYVFVYESSASQFPERDDLQDDLEMAMKACQEDYGVAKKDWTEPRQRDD